MQTEQFKVTGMTCGGCTNNVTRALKGIHGVAENFPWASPSNISQGNLREISRLAPAG